MLNGSTTQDQKALNKLCEDYDSVFMTPVRYLTLEYFCFNLLSIFF